MNRFAFVAFLSLLFLPNLAFGDWAAAFPEASVASYLPASTSKVMVVAVDGGADAAAALAKSLGDAGAVVVGQGALGNVDGKTDAEIVQAAANQPVEVVMVVRLAGDTAIVTTYKTDGTALTGFTASEAQPAPAAGGSGAMQAEVNAAAQSTNDNQPSDAALEEFLNSYVAFQDWVGINQYGAVVSSWSQPYQGQYRKPLGTAEFYDAIEQPEMAKSYRSKSTLKTAIGIPSFLAFLGGATWMTVGLIQSLNAKYDDSAPANAGKAGLYGGGALTVGGLVGMIVAGFINPHPVDAPEARRLTDEYNKRLAKRLGIDIDALTAPQSAVEPPETEYDLVVAPLRDGAFGGVQVRF